MSVASVGRPVVILSFTSNTPIEALVKVLTSTYKIPANFMTFIYLFLRKLFPVVVSRGLKINEYGIILHFLSQRSPKIHQRLGFILLWYFNFYS